MVLIPDFVVSDNDLHVRCFSCTMHAFLLHNSDNIEISYLRPCTELILDKATF